MVSGLGMVAVLLITLWVRSLFGIDNYDLVKFIHLVGRAGYCHSGTERLIWMTVDDKSPAYPEDGGES